MKYWRHISTAIFVLLVFISSACNQNAKIESPPASPAQTDQGITESEQQLLQFITSQQSGEFGILTNRLDTDQSQLAATGHEVLSESAGLLMRYYVNVHDEDGFRRAWTTAKQTFDSEHLFSYRYSPKLNKKYAVNAAIDDLRIIRSLYAAADAFGGSSYLKEANRYAKRFYETNVQDGKLLDFYDESYGEANQSITLCYIDLLTLGKLPISEVEKRRLQSTMRNVIQEGYLSDSFPFYETRYEYEKSRYSSETIRTIESMLTILHLAEVGHTNESSIVYIKKQVRDNHLYGQYTKDGEPSNNIRSTAIYAIAALIGNEIRDDELYYGSLNRMKEFQVTDSTSQLYGGFGDPASGQAYSFDNLMALLAFSAKR